LCDCFITINFSTVVGEVILVHSCAIIFICCDCYLFLLVVVLFIYDSSTGQNIFFSGIRTWPFVSKRETTF